MNKPLKRILPILIGILIIASIIWYLFVYDRSFTQDMLLSQARLMDSRGNHTAAAWLYDLAYDYSGGDETVAIELARQFKERGNYTKAESTLASAIADGGTAELYIALCKTYVEQDKLLDAVTMLDNIADPTVRTEIQAQRPAAPTVSPEPGFYSQYITLAITPDLGQLYVTTDGSYPSITTPSDGALTLMGGETVVYALTVDENGLVSPLSVFGYTVSGVIEQIDLSDPQLDAAVRVALSANSATQLYTNDLWGITALTLPEGAGDYTELSYLPYLQSLTITGSNANSLEGLGTLSNLTELVIRDSNLRTSDLQIIASLPNLEKLTLSNCGISSIVNLSAAKDLIYLDLSQNAIRDFSSLSFMAQLQHLNLSHNALTDLNAVSSLSSLLSLDVSYNSLTSVIPVAGCKALTQLNISNNVIASLSGIEALTALTDLNASFNTLTDLGHLTALTSLTSLDVSSNSLTDVSCLSSLNDLQHFYFSRNTVSTLPNWSKKSQLITIDGSYNAITQVDILSGFENLNYVLMDYNQITSITSLSKCQNLIKVSVYGNAVTDAAVLADMGIIVNYNPLQ